MKIIVISIVGLIWVAANAGSILNENMEVFISEPSRDTVDGIIHKPMDIWTYNKFTGEETPIGTIDLQKYNVGVIV
jgi:hypothetical protein